MFLSSVMSCVTDTHSGLLQNNWEHEKLVSKIQAKGETARMVILQVCLELTFRRSSTYSHLIKILTQHIKVSLVLQKPVTKGKYHIHVYTVSYPQGKENVSTWFFKNNDCAQAKYVICK